MKCERNQETAMSNVTIYSYFESPVGQLLLAGPDSREQVLEIIGFPEGKGSVEPEADWVHSPDGFTEAKRQLGEYFACERKTFELALKPIGTDFQLAVLKALTEIPYGKTASYQEIAKSIGRPKAVRAVGAANGRNPLPIVIPCHRVIGANGSLTGFGGGLEAKAFLLNLESSAFELV
jgi:methylated-DNA-[protein]-cysteine S-methyltransferase